MQRGAVAVVGGAGFVGSAIVRRATASGRAAVSLDRVRQPPPRLPATVEQRAVDLLVDPVELPPGLVVLAAGGSDPHAGDPWRLVFDNAVTIARLLPALAGRQVVLVSSAEVHGPAGGQLRWTTQPWPAGARPCGTRPAGRARHGRWPGCAGSWWPPTRPVAGPTRCPNGRPGCVRSVVAADRLTVLRAANLFGPGQDRVVAQLTRRALAGLPLAVTDTVRTFLPVDDLAAVALDAAPGTLDAGLAALRLTELARLVLGTLGVDVPVTVGPPPAMDVSGPVDAGEFCRRLGVG